MLNLPVLEYLVYVSCGFIVHFLYTNEHRGSSLDVEFKGSLTHPGWYEVVGNCIILSLFFLFKRVCTINTILLELLDLPEQKMRS